MSPDQALAMPIVGRREFTKYQNAWVKEARKR